MVIILEMNRWPIVLIRKYFQNQMLQQPSVLKASTIASQRYYEYSMSVRYLTGGEIVFADRLLSDDRGHFVVLLV